MERILCHSYIVTINETITVAVTVKWLVLELWSQKLKNGKDFSDNLKTNPFYFYC